MHIVGPIRLALPQLDRLWSASFVLLFILSGSASSQALDHARRTGLEAGASDGRKAGREAGYAESFAAAEQAAFAQTLHELAASGSVHALPSYKAGVWVICLTGGFLGQWVLLYLLRRVCGLPDIDWMVFPGRLTEINIGDDFATRLPQAVHRIAPLLLICCLGGCGDGANDAWSRAYDLQYDVDYRAGRAEAASHGTADGRLAGISKAFAVARSGQSWRLYSTHAISATVVGAVLGFAAQYIHLVSVRQSGYLNGMWSLVLVPGIGSSYAYSVYLRRREFMVWMKDELAQLRANQRLRRAQLDSVKSLVYSKAITLADLDQFLQSRLLEAANARMSEIVAAAESEASSTTDSKAKDEPPYGNGTSVDERLEKHEDHEQPADEAREVQDAKPAGRWRPMIDSVTYTVGE